MKYSFIIIFFLHITILNAQTTPVITEQPQDQTVNSGQTAIFTCNFSGPTNKGYQWWKVGGIKVVDGDGISGATTNQLVISNTTLSDDESQYLCEAKDLDFYPTDGSWVNSNTATLLVIEEKIFVGDVTLTTQEEINAFGANGYTAITGSLDIGITQNNSITDLASLSTITSVGGGLWLQSNWALTNLDGLNNITFVGEEVFIYDNNSLTNLDGLNGITYVVEKLKVLSNMTLTNINGLSNITSVGGNLSIENNPILSNIDGLSNVTSVGEKIWIKDNGIIKNLDGLSGITFVVESIMITNNSTLTSINGLSGITSVGGNLKIESNLILTNVDGISRITSVGGSLVLDHNSSLLNVDGLSGITSVGGGLLLLSNWALTNLDGLNNITFVGKQVFINDNSSLTNLDGLSGITSVGENLNVSENIALEEFCGLFPLLDGGGLAGTYSVGDNAVNPTKAQIIAAGPCNEPVTPVITEQPQDLTISIGQSAYFTCNFSGPANKGYQWWKAPFVSSEESKIVDIPGKIQGATTNRLQIYPTNSGDDGTQYLCEVKDLDSYPTEGSWANSNIAKLTIEPSVKITSPSQYFFDVFEVYTNVNIQWIVNSIEFINLEYTINGGKSWIPIVNNYPSSVGKYDWTVPNTPSIFCKLKISDANNIELFSIIPQSFEFENLEYFVVKGENKWQIVEKFTNNSLSDIKFFNKMNGIIWGNKNLLITSDGGETWKVQNDYSWKQLSKVKFINHSTGYGLNGNSIFKTTDEGDSWQTLYLNENIREISDFYFINDSIGWLIEVPQTYTENPQPKLLKTIDGGVTWFGQFTFEFDFDRGDAIVYVDEIIFLTKNIGFAKFFAEGASTRWISLYKTIDGGANWEIIFSGGDELSFSFLNETEGWLLWDFNDNAIQYGRLYRYFNKSKSLYNWYFNGQGYAVGEIYFSNKSSGWFSGDIIDWRSTFTTSTLFINSSLDSGKTWSLDFVETEDMSISSISNFYSYDGYTCWAVGGGGLILRYGNNSETSEQWNFNISITNQGNVSDLKFGQSSNASNEIDIELSESELPPLPTAGTFDARFILENNSSTNLDLRNSADNEINWTIQFQPNTSGYPITFSWDKDNLPFGSFYLKDAITGKIINVDMKLNDSLLVINESINKLQIVYKEELTSTIKTNKDWNLVSISLKADHMETTELFPEATSSAFKYSTGYNSQTTLENGIGYWIKFNESSSTNIYGEEVNSPIQVNEGWNIIGPYNNELDVSQIETTPVNILSGDIYGFDNGYYIADKLEVGKGYWVKAAQDGEISFENTSRLNKSTNELDIEPIISFDIIASNGIGDSIALTFGVDSLGTSGYDPNFGEEELPPMPPLGAFDVRIELPDTLITTYSDIRQLAVDCYEHTISYQLADSSQNLTLSWDLPQGVTLTISDLFGGAIFNESFESGRGEFTIENPNINNAKLILCYSEIILSNRDYEFVPTEYTLSQNYPNPFNPSTIIKFGLPKESEVSVSIYNILGERVKELINQQLKAGFHEVEFNNTYLSSGIYFYRIEAGDYVATRKMILLK